MRPKTLAEVARQTLQEEPFHLCLGNFLDEFYASPYASALTETPPLMASKLADKGQVYDAYLAATAEELARAYHFVFPSWTRDETRMLHWPWFASELASLRAVLILESPVAFRERNLFVSENALSRV